MLEINTHIIKKEEANARVHAKIGKLQKKKITIIILIITKILTQ